MKRKLFISSIIIVFLVVIIMAWMTAYMDGKENPDEQFNEAFPFSYFLPAKQYPQNFNECIEWGKWRAIDNSTDPQRLEGIEKQKKCSWYSNRKMHPLLLHCPTYGKVSEQKMCGDFECSIPIYECYLEFINTNYTPPKKASPDCGPEDRYKFDVTINSKDDFVDFIKNNEINQWVRLDNFKEIPNGEINWNDVSAAIKTVIWPPIEKMDSRTIYSIEYTPSDCSPAQKFTLKMTNDGHVSVYGCCGK